MVCEEIGSGVDDGAMATFHTEVRPRARNLVVEDSSNKTCSDSNGEGNCDGGFPRR